MAKSTLTSENDSQHHSDAPAVNLRTPEAIPRRHVENTRNELRRGFFSGINIFMRLER